MCVFLFGWELCLVVALAYLDTVLQQPAVCHLTLGVSDHFIGSFIA